MRDRFVLLVTSVLVALLLGVLGVAALVGPQTSLGQVGGELPRDRIATMEADGSLEQMLEQRQAMMQQMQAGATPQMLEIMRRDPMWTMLRSGEMIRLMERHQANVERMLAKR